MGAGDERIRAGRNLARRAGEQRQSVDALCQRRRSPAGVGDASRSGPRADGGAIFSGENGKIEINRNLFRANPPDLIKNPPPRHGGEVGRGRLDCPAAHSELARLHQNARAAQRRRGNRPPLGQRLPSGEHRPRNGPQAPLGPGEGEVHRRRRREHVGEPPAAKGI